MGVDLAFVVSDVHRDLLREVLDRTLGDEAVVGVLLTGSVARGDAYPGSDLDLYLLLGEGLSRPFAAQVRRGIAVECHTVDFEAARAEIEGDPMRVYAYLDGRILYDPQGRLGQLVDLARARLAAYRAPARERRKLAYWLRSARDKMIAARAAGDPLQAAFVAGTTSWPIVEGLWMANDRPVPPNGAVRAHLGDLSRTPPGFDALWRRLFGGDAATRVQAAIEMIDWLVPALEA